MNLLERRRSIRKYTDQRVESEKIRILIEAALRSPSGRGINPWEFIIVEDRGILSKLAQAKQSGAAFLKGAPLGIVVCANPEKSDTFVEDASIASIIIQLAAESLGLGSCWIQMRNRYHRDGRPAQEHIAQLLDMPEHCIVQSVIAIGYPAETKAPHPKESLSYEKVHKV
jgi:nitroreductase